MVASRHAVVRFFGVLAQPSVAPRGRAAPSALLGRVRWMSSGRGLQASLVARAGAVQAAVDDTDHVVGGGDLASRTAHIRNVAIIAHVDHGKTTLVDKLLQACNENISGERVMDSNALESERGITILAKCTSVRYRDHLINIVDTPGHADFGGEVERILNMVDSVILLVDATEGPMTQTKFVLGKALKRNLNPIVLLNKVDRDTARIKETENDIFDLFALLGATDEQLNFPTLYASGREGWAVRNVGDQRQGMAPLLDTVIERVPPPAAINNRPHFAMLVTIIQKEAFLGRIVTGRIASGTVRVGDPIHTLSRTGTKIETAKVTKILKQRGVSRVELPQADAGDIVTIAGVMKATVTDTVAAVDLLEPIEVSPIDPPTVTMTFSANDSPLAGRVGNKLTSQQIGERLRAETETNVSIRVIENQGESYEVQGRGEMQLGVLIENMRREGFELSVSPPTVVYREENGKRLEPSEEVNIEVDDQYAGAVIEKLSLRKGELKAMVPQSGGKTRLQFSVPSRGLMGYRAVFLVDTHGTGVMNRVFEEYVPFRGAFEKVRKGALVSMDNGNTTAYALELIEPRGSLFVSPGEEVYEGMIVGEHSRDNDLDLNPVRTKKLTNIRTHSHDEQVRLTPPRQFSLEEALGYVGPDELLEITPKNIRMRKRVLDSNLRKTAASRGKK